MKYGIPYPKIFWRIDSSSTPNSGPGITVLGWEIIKSPKLRTFRKFLAYPEFRTPRIVWRSDSDSTRNLGPGNTFLDGLSIFRVEKYTKVLNLRKFLVSPEFRTPSMFWWTYWYATQNCAASNSILGGLFFAIRVVISVPALSAGFLISAKKPAHLNQCSSKVHFIELSVCCLRVRVASLLYLNKCAIYRPQSVRVWEASLRSILNTCASMCAVCVRESPVYSVFS